MIEISTVRTPTAWETVRAWSGRRIVAALLAAIGTALLIGLPTDVIPNPIFGRPVPVTWWSYPTLGVTALLGGLLAATYLRRPPSDPSGQDADEIDTPTRTGGAAGLLSFFAVGCPVCNKIVVVALGTTGARQWFEPMQPLLAIASVALLWWALRARLRSESMCSLATTRRA